MQTPNGSQMHGEHSPIMDIPQKRNDFFSNPLGLVYVPYSIVLQFFI